MTVITALAVALNLLLVQAAPELTLGRVAELERGLDLNAVLASRIATYVPPHTRLAPVNQLSRTYSLTQVNGRVFIQGHYTSPRGSDRAGVHLGEPNVAADGGCNTVWVIFMPDTGRPVGAWCNGVA